jgi:hypothetical protein
MMMLLKRESLSFHCSSRHSNCDIIDDCSALFVKLIFNKLLCFSFLLFSSLAAVLWLKFFVYKNFYDRNNGGFERTAKEKL